MDATNCASLKFVSPAEIKTPTLNEVITDRSIVRRCKKNAAGIGLKLTVKYVARTKIVG